MRRILSHRPGAADVPPIYETNNQINKNVRIRRLGPPYPSRRGKQVLEGLRAARQIWLGGNYIFRPGNFERTEYPAWPTSR
jgi:hypothetical protein